MGKVLRFNGALPQRFFGLTGPWGPIGATAWQGSKGSEGVVSPLRSDEYEVSVTGFGFVSPVLHDKELEPPSLGRG